MLTCASAPAPAPSSPAAFPEHGGPFCARFLGAALQGHLAPLDLAVIGAVIGGAAAASSALWYYSSRCAPIESSRCVRKELCRPSLRSSSGRGTSSLTPPCRQHRVGWAAHPPALGLLVLAIHCARKSPPSGRPRYEAGGTFRAVKGAPCLFPRCFLPHPVAPAVAGCSPYTLPCAAVQCC